MGLCVLLVVVWDPLAEMEMATKRVVSHFIMVSILTLWHTFISCAFERRGSTGFDFGFGRNCAGGRPLEAKTGGKV